MADKKKDGQNIKKRRPNAAYYYGHSHGRNMVRRALRMVRRERKYQRWLGRRYERMFAAGVTEGLDVAVARRAWELKKKARMDRVLGQARTCAEQHMVLGAFNTALNA